jgi:predicted nuclease of restriction endonuclease-like RecB superfamily
MALNRKRERCAIREQRWRQRPLLKRLLDAEITPERLLPRYLGQRDRVWVAELRERLLGLEGRQRAEVEQRIAEGPGWGERPRAWRAMGQLLIGQLAFVTRSRFEPRALRRQVFTAAAAAPPGQLPRITLSAVARQLELAPQLEPAPEPEELLAAIYADRRAERRLRSVTLLEQLGPEALIERYNLALVQGLLCRAERVELLLDEQVKAVLREARLARLLVLAEAAGAGPAATGPAATRLHLSGPLSLFRHTLRYGRQLARWLPVVTALRGRWRLTARVRLDDDAPPRRLELAPGDPIGSTHRELRRFDSKVEARLFADLEALPAGQRWQVLREADPVQLGRRIVCPDFVLVEREAGRRVAVEIVGFWTEAYLRYKLALLRALPPSSRWLLCVDASLAADVEAAVPDLPLLRYERRVDAEALLSLIELMKSKPTGPSMFGGRHG